MKKVESKTDQSLSNHLGYSIQKEGEQIIYVFMQEL